jgi:hypothetical protein
MLLYFVTSFGCFLKSQFPIPWVPEIMSSSMDYAEITILFPNDYSND